MKVTALVDGPTPETGIKVETSPHDPASIKVTIGGASTTVKAKELIDASRRAVIDQHYDDF